MLPTAFQEKMRRLLGAEYDAFLAAYELPRNVALRFRNAGQALLELPFCEAAVPWEPNGRYCLPGSRPGLHPFHDAGVYYLQEPSAMAPARLLDVQPGQRVLDLCAAPGGKATQLAAALQGQGLLVANEIHPKRARILSSNIERLGVTNALVLNEHPARLAERFPDCFDRILVDAPCSGEGMFRKEEAAVADWSEETVLMCAARQREILCSAAQMLAPGGRLVYSTCTFSPEENEGVISAFLKTHPDFSVCRMDAPWFSSGRPDWIDDPADGLEHTLRLFPHKLRGEGHFAAVLTRQGENGQCLLAEERLQPLPQEAVGFLRECGIAAGQRAILSGETVYLAPEGLPQRFGLHVLRAGLELGQVRKGRFLPAHALALARPDYAQTVELPAESDELAAYLRGQTLPTCLRGWVLVRTDGFALGWAYGADGILKNHYPKGLRKVGS